MVCKKTYPFSDMADHRMRSLCRANFPSCHNLIKLILHHNHSGSVFLGVFDGRMVVFCRQSSHFKIFLPSLKLAANAPKNRPYPKMKGFCLPSLSIFRVRTGSEAISPKTLVNAPPPGLFMSSTQKKQALKSVVQFFWKINCSLFKSHKTTGRWFQPIWKILVKMGIFPK